MNLGFSPQRVGRPATPKNVVLVVSPDITAQCKGEQFTDAWAALLMSEKQFYGRMAADDDGAVRWLSGLISSTPANRPEWTTALHEALTPLGKYSYEIPSSADNMSSCEREITVDGKTQLLAVPGAWTFQCLAHTGAKLMQMLAKLFEITMFHKAGFTENAGSKILQRTVTGTSNTWTEAIILTLMPIGCFKNSDAQKLRSWASTHTWMQWDGSMGHCAVKDLVPSSMPFQALSPDDVKSEAARKMDAMVMLYHGIHPTAVTTRKTLEPSSDAVHENRLVPIGKPSQASRSIQCSSQTPATLGCKDISCDAPQSVSDKLQISPAASHESRSLSESNQNLIPEAFLIDLVQSKLIPSLKDMSASLTAMSNNLWTKARAQRSPQFATKAATYGKLATPMLLSEVPSDKDAMSAGIWERWWNTANDWLEEIEAFDIDIKDSAVLLVAITKIALGSSEGYSLAASLDKEDVDAVMRSWGYEPNDDKKLQKQRQSAHKQLQNFISAKLLDLHKAVEVLWSKASTESDIQHIEQRSQQITTLQYYDDQTIDAMLLGSKESDKLLMQLCQVFDEKEKKNVMEMITDTKTQKKTDD